MTCENSRLSDCVNQQSWTSFLLGLKTVTSSGQRTSSTPGRALQITNSHVSARQSAHSLWLNWLESPPENPLYFWYKTIILQNIKPNTGKFGAQIKIQLGKPTLSSWNNNQLGGLNLSWNLKYGPLWCPQPRPSSPHPGALPHLWSW